MKQLIAITLFVSYYLKSEIYEIRDYTIEEEFFDAYVYWAENHFMPYGNERIEIIDFWVSRGKEAIVEGTNPIVSPNGQPNVTWVAKYKSREERDAFFNSLDTDPEWERVWSKHPNPDAYIHSNARFFRSID